MVGFVRRRLVQLRLDFHHQLRALEHRLADADQVRQCPADANTPERMNIRVR